MERSSDSKPKFSFKLDLEAVATSQLKEPLMKYRTLGEKEERKKIEEISEYSDFESSDGEENRSEDPNKFRSTESGVISEGRFPKLLKVTPRKKITSERGDFQRLSYNSNSIYITNQRSKGQSETEYSEDEVRSLKSIKQRKQMQIETMKALAPIIWKVICLIISCIAASCAPSLLLTLPGNNMLILVAWKLQITLLIIGVLAMFELRNRDGDSVFFGPRSANSNNFKFCGTLVHTKKVIYMVIAAAMYILWLIGLLEAIRHSIVLHAMMLNSLGIFIGPLTSFLFCRSFNMPKLISVCFASCGVGLMLYSSYKGDCQLQESQFCDMRFDILNIASSIAGYIYFNKIEQLNKSIPCFTLMTMIMTIALVFSFIFFFIKMQYDGINHFTTDIETGVFGWINSPQAMMQCLLVIGLIGSLLGNFGYLYCLNFNSAIVVSNVLFLEPFMGQYIAVYLIQINQSPPIYSIMGAVIVALGMYICREAFVGRFEAQAKRKIRVEPPRQAIEIKDLSCYSSQDSL